MLDVRFLSEAFQVKTNVSLLKVFDDLGDEEFPVHSYAQDIIDKTTDKFVNRIGLCTLLSDGKPGVYVKSEKFLVYALCRYRGFKGEIPFKSNGSLPDDDDIVVRNVIGILHKSWSWHKWMNECLTPAKINVSNRTEALASANRVRAFVKKLSYMLDDENDVECKKKLLDEVRNIFNK